MVASNNSKSSTSASTGAAAPKVKTKTRRPPVAERVTVSAAIAVPPAGPAATPAVTPATPTAAAGSSGSGSAAPLAPAPITAPPPALIPTVPAGFVPANPADFKGFHAMASQVAAVPDAVTELRGFTGYSSVFGITAPDVAQLTQRLNVAFQWTMLLSQTAAWYKYAKSEQAMAWKDAITLVLGLKPAFDLATTANPALLSQYPALARLLGAQAVVAKRAAVARAKGKKVPAQTSTSSAAAEASPTPPAPLTAGMGGETPPNGASAPTRLVTVQG